MIARHYTMSNALGSCHPGQCEQAIRRQHKPRKGSDDTYCLVFYQGKPFARNLCDYGMILGLVFWETAWSWLHLNFPRVTRTFGVQWQGEKST